MKRFFSGARGKEKKPRRSFLPEYVSNEDLTAGEIPPRGAPWHEIALFSLTFDGYSRTGSFNRCTPVPDGGACETLSEIRARLLFEHRRCIAMGKRPGKETLELVYDLLERMREKLARGERA